MTWFMSLWAGLACGGIGLLIAGAVAARFTKKSTLVGGLRQLVFGALAIAATFGVSPLTVERRLKLASLAPVFLDLYRVGKIELGQLQALEQTQVQQIAMTDAQIEAFMGRR